MHYQHDTLPLLRLTGRGSVHRFLHSKNALLCPTLHASLLVSPSFCAACSPHLRAVVGSYALLPFRSVIWLSGAFMLMFFDSRNYLIRRVQGHLDLPQSRQSLLKLRYFWSNNWHFMIKCDILLGFITAIHFASIRLCDFC